MATLQQGTLTEQQRKNTIDVLKDIANHVADSQSGYEQSADLVKNDEVELADYFRSCAAARAKTLQELKASLQSIDASIDLTSMDGTTSGSLHQAFTSFRSKFQDSRKAALAEIERGEEYLVEQLQDALDKDIDPQVSELLRRFHAELSRHEEKIEDLRAAS